ncbi:MAG: class A beta-lactamase [Tatlockia sp.]|nr:class A beta-lactamase [Tatlockia sp.]
MKHSKQILKITLLAFTLASSPLTSFADSLQKQFVDLENSSGGRIGISAINTGNGMTIKYRANERFPVGCTAKVIGVSAILKKSMTDKTFLNQRITYSKKDLTNWTPITKKHLREGMTIAELAAASISYSDNTAMNLLAAKIGGPKGITNFARSIGDEGFRLDHGWPEEAMSGPKDLTDSTTPSAMAKTFEKLALGKILGLPQQKLLQTWLINNRTGKHRIRAAVPKGWIVGDKTGSGFFHGTTNDIGLIWAPKCKPIVVAIYYTNDKKEAVKREDIIVSATRILLKEFAGTDQCIKRSLPS